MSDNPREHHKDCNSLCEYTDWGIDVCYECPNGHTYHECTCDDLAESAAYNAAEALAADRDQLWDFGDWQR